MANSTPETCTLLPL
ncbi:hypothetical protein YPPY32_1186, partial [Yersinia pestis PY-32]